MNVMIKGMNLPERGCNKCFFRNGNWCSLLPDVPAVAIINSAKLDERHKDCPICEVDEDSKSVHNKTKTEGEKQMTNAEICYALAELAASLIHSMHGEYDEDVMIYVEALSTAVEHYKRLAIKDSKKSLRDVEFEED